MGCEESRTIECEKRRPARGPRDTIETEEIEIINTYKGILCTAKSFKDTIIYSDQDLEEKVTQFIATQVPVNGNPSKQEPNTLDDILTRSYKIDFNEYVVIAVNGVKIDRIGTKLGNYVLYHKGETRSSTEYCAYVVRKLLGTPKLIFEPSKPTLFDEH